MITTTNLECKAWIRTSNEYSRNWTFLQTFNDLAKSATFLLADELTILLELSPALYSYIEGAGIPLRTGIHEPCQISPVSANPQYIDSNISQQ